MKCEKCQEREAKVRYTEYREGGSKKLLICFECAREFGFEIDTPEENLEFPLPELNLEGEMLLSTQLKPLVTPVPEKERCPRCGMTSGEFQRVSRFGCSTCYETFTSSLDLWFEKIHGATQHRGRLPRRFQSGEGAS